MRIAIVGPTWPFRGGIAHHTTLLAQTLVERGHDVRFFSFIRQYPRWLFPGESDRDPSAASWKFAGTRYLLDPLNPLTWHRTARAILASKPDLVLFPWWVSYWAPPFRFLASRVRKRSGAEVVYVCHNVREHESSSIRRRLAKAALARGNRFIVSSEEEGAQLRALVPNADFRIHGHPVYRIPGDEAPGKQEARDRLGIEEGPVLLFFGIVRHYKGLDLLIRALPKIRQQVPARLLIAGEFWESRGGIEKLAEECGVAGSVRITDRYIPNEEVADYFAACDLVVAPYRSVTGSGVVQMALAFGRPVVAARIGSLANVLGGETRGKLFEPENIEALAAVVVAALQPDELRRLTVGAGEAMPSESWDSLARMVAGD